MNQRLVITILLLLFTILPAESQCAMCRAVIESEESNEVAKGINNGIIYLMIFPYLLVGGIGYIIYRSRKNLKRRIN